MEKNNDRYLVIVNPNSGSKKGAKDWDHIARLLTSENITFDNIFTEHKNHAIYLSREAVINGYRKIIVVGGDGTMNEVINGIFSQDEVPSMDIKIGMIPVGTGNDWGRMYGIPNNYKKAVGILKNGSLYTQDAGKITYHLKGEKHKRFFVNMAGVGYDAFVAYKTNKMKEKGRGGVLAYLINLITGLVQYRFKHMILRIDAQEVFNGKVFSAAIGICKFNGGGMLQLPFAIPNNGKFDITLIKKASKFKVISNIKNLYDGSFVKIPEVETFEGKKVSIESKPKHSMYLEADGESLGHTPLDFEIIPKSISLIAGKTVFEKKVF